ncbi:right-handed parallel beta-helix repeat-containing protein [bacterium]|nr:right-handed parallel beta-helix repeat-containing protein [bacterium]
MKRILRLVLVAATVLPVVFAAGNAGAQATRTWVSGVGDDANPCSRTAPCKTFAGAIPKTAARGEINVLDPGPFGAVTITKSITIASDSTQAGVLASGSNAIVINAGPTDRVVLRGLDIEGLGAGLRGVQVVAAGEVHVERCIVNAFSQAGIGFEPSGAAQLWVRDTVVRGSNTGIVVHGTNAPVDAFVSRSSIDSNAGPGIRVLEGSTATIADSFIGGNDGDGVFVRAAGSPAKVLVERSTIAGNAGAGVMAGGGASFAIARIGADAIFANTRGLEIGSNGQIVSFGDNHVADNGSTVPPTAIQPKT